MDRTDGGRRNAVPAPAGASAGRRQGLQAVTDMQRTARERRNVFEALIEAVKMHSFGQISHALYDVGGEYRRNM